MKNADIGREHGTRTKKKISKNHNRYNYVYLINQNNYI